MQYATQLYTLRSLPSSSRCQSVADAGFGGVELVGLDAPPDLSRVDLDVAGVHVDAETLETDPDDAVTRTNALGTDTLVVPIVEEQAFHPAAVEETAARLDALAASIEAAGGRLLYHNHEFEFAGEERGDGDETPFERLVDATTHIGFELDVGWATAAGVDPVSLVERFGHRIPFVHLKDVRIDAEAPRGGVPVDLGAGDVDLDGVLTAAEEAGVEWVVFEHDDPDEPARTVRDAADWLGVEPSGPR